MADDFEFDYKELTGFRADLLKKTEELYPKETKKFLKREATKGSKVAKNIAKSLVGTSKGVKKDWIEKKSYHKRFKSGKVYTYAEDDTCCRFFNSAPHSHLIEYGHKNVDGTFTAGKHVMEKAEVQFSKDFVDDCDKFLGEFFDKEVFNDK